MFAFKFDDTDKIVHSPNRCGTSTDGKKVMGIDIDGKAPIALSCQAKTAAIISMTTFANNANLKHSNVDPNSSTNL